MPNIILNVIKLALISENDAIAVITDILFNIFTTFLLLNVRNRK